MSGWRGVTFSVGQGRGRWLSLTQLASLPEMEGKESRDRYLYSRQLDRQDDVISKEMEQHYDYKQEHMFISTSCWRQIQSCKCRALSLGSAGWAPRSRHWAVGPGSPEGGAEQEHSESTL